MYLVQYTSTTCPDLCIFLTLQLTKHELFSQHDSSTALGHFTDIPSVGGSEDCHYNLFLHSLLNNNNFLGLANQVF